MRHQYFDFLPSKRKLEESDYSSVDVLGTRIRKNSSANSKGKAVDDHESESSTDRSYLLRDYATKLNGDCSRFELQFLVKMISGGKTLVLRANCDDTVEMVHRMIQMSTGIPVMEQGLVYRGKQLQWEHTLKQCGVQNGAGLQLVGRLRSTQHSRAWRVITDMVSIIFRVCSEEFVNLDSGLVKVKLEQFMALLLDKSNDSTLLPFRDDRKHGRNKKIDLNVVDYGEEEDEHENNGNINKIDCCKIFMDACASQALVMFYGSPKKRNQVSADDCIRCFVSFVKDLEGSRSERAYCAVIVLEFCKLLRMTVAEDNALYLHCRKTLGSMLDKIEVVNRDKGTHSPSEREMIGISMQDVFPFLKEVGQRLMKDLTPGEEPNASFRPLHRHVCDFSAFLQPMLSFMRRELAAAADSCEAREKVSYLADEVDCLLDLFTELLRRVGICLNQMELPLAMKRKKNVETDQVEWSQYLHILNILYSISVLYPGSEDQFWTTMRQNKAAVSCLIVGCVKHSDDHSWLLKHKDVLDFESRRHLATLMFPEVREDYEELYEMLIDRSQLLTESFEYISRAQPDSLHAGLFMEFKNEEATGPGVLREWFCLVCQAIFDPQNALFVACPLDRRRFFPSPVSKVDPLHLQYFRFSGRVIALALMHKIQVGIILDRLFFLQLAGRHVSMEDIRDADPCIYHSCKQILEMDTEFVDSDGLGLTFVTEVEELGSRKVVELCSGGRGIVVNSKNRKEYVDLIVQHRFVRPISEQVYSFAQGFADILRESRLRETFFETLELEDLDWMLHGSESEISIEDWKAHTDYQGYKISDPQIVWFWEIVGQLNGEQKKRLLFFWTSLQYLPVEGFRGLASRVFIYRSLESQDHLPSSHTCFYRLCMPPYSSKALMQERILVITQEHVSCSFGTW